MSQIFDKLKFRANLRKHGIDIVFYLGIFVLLAIRVPGWIESYEMQGQKFPELEWQDLSRTKVQVDKSKKTAIIFWATWCGPCQIELKRLNSMVQAGEIPADSVWAVSVAEELGVVANTVRERGYVFNVGVDETGVSTSKLRIQGTPTLFLLDPDLTIHYKTTGLSPLLSLRLKSFFHGWSLSL